MRRWSNFTVSTRSREWRFWISLAISLWNRQRQHADEHHDSYLVAHQRQEPSYRKARTVGGIR